MNVLMVCLGNICRSPLAQGILQHKINNLGLQWNIDSAGTGGWHQGQHPDPRSIEVAESNGINIANQTARQIHTNDLNDFDLILTMDRNNYNDVMRLDTEQKYFTKVRPLMSYLPDFTPQNVPDPYYGGAEGFQKVFDMINLACDQVIKESMMTISI